MRCARCGSCSTGAHCSAPSSAPGPRSLGVWLAGAEPEHLPYTVLLVIAIAIVGFVGRLPRRGVGVRSWGCSSSSMAALPGQEVWTVADSVRFIAFLFGSPVIVYLARRAEEHRDLAAARARREPRRASARRTRSASGWNGATQRARRRRWRAAERERARLEEVAEAIPEPLIVYDDRLRGTYGNRAALRLFGSSFVERPLDEWGRMTEPRDEQGKALDRDEWPQVRAQRAAFRRRLTLRIPMSGRDVIVDTEGTPIPGGGAVLLLRDIGKEEDERRRLSRFASFVAHELRNPLAVAKARIELAQRDPALPARAGGHAVARARVGRCRHRDPRAARALLARGHGQRRGAPRGVRARPGARPPRSSGCARGDRAVTCGSSRPTASRCSATATSASRPSRTCSPTRTATRRRAARSTSRSRDGDQVTLRVRDEGPGIKDDVARRLFRDRVSAGRGLGLGLFLVQATMAAMGGSVQLEQRTPVAVFSLRWERPPAGGAAQTGA